MDLAKKKKDLIKQLKAAKAKVTPEDKSGAHLEYGVSIRTQERYLNGDVDSIPVAQSLINFFTKCIDGRKSKVSA